MLNALYITLLMLGTAGQFIAKKDYNKKLLNKGVFLFNSIAALSAGLFFLVSNGFKLTVSAQLMPYTLGYALCYAFTGIVGFIAICIGPLSLTSLITSYSLIIPTFYGLIFLGDSVGVFFWIGFALLAVSLFLINSPSAETKITFKWVICAVLTFAGNGACALLQTMQQRAFDGKYGNDMMVTALLIAAAITFIAALVQDRGSLAEGMKRGSHLMAICGVSNGLANLMLILLLPRMLAAVLFPVISAGQLITSWIVSRFIYREKLSVSQNIALVLGTVAIVLMNL